MSGNFYAKRTQLLHQSPDFGTRAPNLLRKFRSAYDHGGIAHEHADDAAETCVGFKRRRPALRTTAVILCRFRNAELCGTERESTTQSANVFIHVRAIDALSSGALATLPQVPGGHFMRKLWFGLVPTI